MSFSLTHSPTPIRSFPIVALREGVVFPSTEAHLTFGRPKSSSAIEAAIKADKQVVFVAQKQPLANPKPEDLYSQGTLCLVEQVAPYGNDQLLAVVRGLTKVQIGPYTSHEPFFAGQVSELPEAATSSDKLEALARQIVTEFKNAFNLGKTVEFPVFMRLMSGVAASELANQVANSLDLSTVEKQELLEMVSLEAKLEKILSYLVHEIKILELEKSISSKTHARFEKNMREQVLRERQRTIQEELEKMGAQGEDADDDISLLRKQIKLVKMPPQVRQKAEKELSRLSQMSPHNPEGSYVRSYLDWLVAMPWSKTTTNKVSLDRANKILDEDHSGLKKVKERIIEYLAVMKLKSSASAAATDGPTILCFSGPPGVGKTSIGRSIARALGRKFARVSLGGIRDEAEIRGHRRTYVGSLPGRIIQGIKNAGTKNPVFMLDEIDKLGTDYRGDPSSALLEALDPEQNREFSDHYLEVPFDLSQVMFITTANLLDPIPPALRDRLEVITFPGYTIDEKMEIATAHLWSKQLTSTGLPKAIRLDAVALREVIHRYTREAGVRDLERQLAKICRKLAKSLAEKKPVAHLVSVSDIHKFLGPFRFPETLAEKKDEVGMSTGLAWTEAGGDVLFIEVALMPGRGELKLTGHLGDVMKESAQAAYSYIRSRWQKLGLKQDFYRKLDIHVHVPEGAVPKDGPSAGLAIATAIVSALTNIPSRRDLAMTGEITLRGRALEIGGVKEKVIAAHQAGIKQVILPKDNKKDLEDIPPQVKRDLKFHFVSHLDDVLKIALRNAVPSSTQPSPRFITATA